MSRLGGCERTQVPRELTFGKAEARGRGQEGRGTAQPGDTVPAPRREGGWGARERGSPTAVLQLVTGRVFRVRLARAS